MAGQEMRRRRRGGRPPLSDGAAPETTTSPRHSRPRPDRGEDWIYGRHAVAAALANPQRRWRRLAVLSGQEEEAALLVAAARAERRGSADGIEVLDRAAFDAILPEGAVHQGWALRVEPLDPPDLDDVLRAIAVTQGAVTQGAVTQGAVTQGAVTQGAVTQGAVTQGAVTQGAMTEGRALIVMLDQVSDPHNVGAVLRSAAAFGAAAVIVPDHGTPPPGPVLAKAASGALDLVPLVRVVNLARALDRLKDAGFWSCGLAEDAPTPLSGADLGSRAVLVLGAEGGGLRRLVRERCDLLARLPTRPEMPSLNVSNAAAVALYELIRRTPEQN